MEEIEPAEGDWTCTSSNAAEAPLPHSADMRASSEDVAHPLPKIGTQILGVIKVIHIKRFEKLIHLGQRLMLCKIVACPTGRLIVSPTCFSPFHNVDTNVT